MHFLLISKSEKKENWAYNHLELPLICFLTANTLIVKEIHVPCCAAETTLVNSDPKVIFKKIVNKLQM